MIDAEIADELPGIYLELDSRSRGHTLVLPRTASSASNSEPGPSIAAASPFPGGDVHPFFVEPGAQVLHVLAAARNVKTSDWSPAIAIIAPDETVYTPVTPNDATVEPDPLYILFRIPNPVAGDWNMVVFATGSTPQLSHVVAGVDNDAPDCFVDARPRIFQSGTGVRLTIGASFFTDLGAGVEYTGTVLRPDGTMSPLSFAFDETTQSAEALFADFIGRGVYQASVRCNVAVGTPVIAGESVFGDDEQDDTLAEGFTRSATTAFFEDSTTNPPLPPGDDCDGDGIEDSAEAPGDTDGDGLPDVCDDDAADDDIPDEVDADPTHPGPFPTAQGWPVFRQSASHAGRSAFDGPDTATLEWQYSLGFLLHDVRSSPSVGPDGSVYFGSQDNRVYALTPDGALKWAPVERCTAVGAGLFEGAIEAIQGTRKAHQHIHVVGKLENRGAVLLRGIATQKVAQKSLCGVALKRKLLGGAQTCVHHQSDRKRPVRSLLKNCDVARHPSVNDREVILFKVADGRAVGIFDVDENGNQADVDFEADVFLVFLRGGREDGGGQHEQCRNAVADLHVAVPAGRGTDSSQFPSTQTSPSSKYSFFQIGTRCLRRLIASRLAS
jgi:hypothetical protein